MNIGGFSLPVSLLLVSKELSSFWELTTPGLLHSCQHLMPVTLLLSQRDISPRLANQARGGGGGGLTMILGDKESLYPSEIPSIRDHVWLELLWTFLTACGQSQAEEKAMADHIFSKIITKMSLITCFSLTCLL